MMKKLIFCVLSLCLLLLITPVLADTERITNGGFETGDLTGWTVPYYGGWTVDYHYLVDGSYEVYGEPNTGTPHYSGLNQTVDFTDVDHLTFLGYADFGNIVVYIDSGQVYSNDCSAYEGGICNANIDVSGYTGQHTLSFFTDSESGYALDDISAIASEPTPTPSPVPGAATDSISAESTVLSLGIAGGICGALIIVIGSRKGEK